MKLQAGKRYIKRNGEVSGVLEDTSTPVFPFRDSKSELTYTAKGHLVMSKEETRYDLVGECVEASNVKKIITNRWSTLDGYAEGLGRTSPGVTAYDTETGTVYILDDRITHDPYKTKGGLWVVCAEIDDQTLITGSPLYNQVVGELDTQLISEAERKDSEV